jgi:hypothetical protein
MNRKKYSRYRCVHEFIVAFEELAPGQGENVVAEMEDFCKGYRDGKEETWAEALDLNVERTNSEPTARTLAAVMTDMHIKPGHFCKARA